MLTPVETPELLCILEMLGSMKRDLVVQVDTLDGSVKCSYSAHRRVLMYLLDYFKEAEERGVMPVTAEGTI